MDNAIINNNVVRENKTLKSMQKKARKYYGSKFFTFGERIPKSKITKIVDIENIKFLSLMEENFKEASIDLNSLTKEQLIRECKKYNLTGGSGNGFPIEKKLALGNYNKGTLIINAVECDPGLIQDAWLYRNKLSMVEKGCNILNKVFNFNEMILITREPLTSKKYSFKQVKVKDRFPMGYENFIIKEVLGVNLNNNEHPSDKNILVCNIQTVISIAEMLMSEDYKEGRYFTVANTITGQGVVVKAPIGMDIVETYEKAFSKHYDKNLNIYTGGGALYCHKVAPREKVSKTTSFIALGQMPNFEEAGRCKGCGACIRNCPMGVKISKIVKAIENNGKTITSELKQYDADNCIYCGACTFLYAVQESI